MKITVEPETEEEKRKFKDALCWEKVFEVAVVGTRRIKGLVDDPIEWCLVDDSCWLRGRLFCCIERLRENPNNDVGRDSK